MTFHFGLLFRSYFQSIFNYRSTGGRVTLKRFFFTVTFPVWYSLLELVNWSCLFLDDLIFPGYRDVAVSKPVFIVGFPRSGTTYLHRLLDSDREQFTSLKLWEILFAPSILQKKVFLFLGKLDRWLGKPFYRVISKLEERIFKESRNMHKISHFEAEEDEIILIHIFASLFLYFMFPFEEIARFSRFDTDVDHEQRRKIMVFYKKCVQRHLFVFGPEKHFLSKNPASSSKINAIYETFPDAKIVCMVRHPFEAIASAISWVSYGIGQFNDMAQSVLTEKILAIMSHWYTYPLTELDRRPQKSRAIESYNDLVKNPGEFVRQLNLRFDLAISTSMDAFLSNESEKAKNYRSRHDYSLAQYGLSMEEVNDSFKYIFERFGFVRN